MQIKSVNYIINSSHYARARGVKTSREFILKIREDIHKKRGVIVQIKDLDKLAGKPVRARIWQGQWIADCECRGASFVDPEEPIFFCFCCGNRSNSNRPRPVVFPENWKEIEALVLERPVDDMAGLTDLERAGMAKPLIMVEGKGGLSRNWNPNETAEELRAQNEPIAKWHKELKKGGV